MITISQSDKSTLPLIPETIIFEDEFQTDPELVWRDRLSSTFASEPICYLTGQGHTAESWVAVYLSPTDEEPAVFSEI